MDKYECTHAADKTTKNYSWSLKERAHIKSIYSRIYLNCGWQNKNKKENRQKPKETKRPKKKII